MIIRIVRMTFQPENVSTFIDVFDQSKEHILKMKGCLYLELWRDIHQPNVYLTHSHWETEEALNNYRSTEFFAEVWKKTKVLFSAKAEAYSVQKVI